MSFFDALLNTVSTAGMALGMFGAFTLVAGAMMSLFVDLTHPVLQSPESPGDAVQPSRLRGDGASDAVMVAT